jgi:hypothetical protein
LELVVGFDAPQFPSGVPVESDDEAGGGKAKSQ